MEVTGCLYSQRDTPYVKIDFYGFNGYSKKMDVISTILGVAKVVGVSGELLVAICSHESANFHFSYVEHDHGSPSFSACQVKEASARQMGFDGEAYELNDLRVGAYWAAKYLKYQEERYGDDWCVLASAYNAGSFLPSKKHPGMPKNLKYVKLVQNKLPEDLKPKLDCRMRSFK